MSVESPGPDRLPPHSRDAERSVLGCLLRDNTMIGDVLHIVPSPENFYFDAHQKIFQAIRDLYDQGQPVDLLILTERLRQQKHLEDVGGTIYLAELWDAAPTAANAEYYAKIVREKAMVRNLIHAGNEILRDAYDQHPAGRRAAGQAERKIMEIAEMGMTGDTKTLQDAINEAYDPASTSAGRQGRPGHVSGIADRVRRPRQHHRRACRTRN